MSSCKFHLRSVLIFAAVATFWAGCGGSSSNPPSGGATPNVSPNPSTSPSPATLNWLQVMEQQSCPYPQCPASDGFTVQNDGTYLTGSGISGQVTSNELATLSTAASTVAANANLLAYTCVPQQTLPGASSASVNETYSSGITEQIYHTDSEAQQFCFRGSKENAQALYNAMNSLAQKYDVPGATQPSTPAPFPSP